MLPRFSLSLSPHIKALSIFSLSHNSLLCYTQKLPCFYLLFLGTKRRKMYTQKLNQRREKYKHFHPEYHQFDPKNPTFSSSLLDQINKSLKTNPKTEQQDFRKGGKNRGESQEVCDGQKMSSLRRACLVEKWMEEEEQEEEVSEKVICSSHGRRKPRSTSSLPSSPLTARSKSRTSRKTTLLDEFNDEQVFYSATTTTTTTETEYYSVSVDSRAPHWPRLPKPVRTREAIESRYLVGNQGPGLDGRARSRALPPVSPGARLTSFLTSLFERKKSKSSKSKTNNKYDWKSDQATPAETPTTTCSSATSFSRSCLSRNSSPTKSSSKKNNPRTVRFCPVSVILDEDSRPCGQKSLYVEGNEVEERENARKVARSISKRYQELRKLNRDSELEERENAANRKKKLQQQQQQKELEEVALDLLNGYWDSTLSKSHINHNQIDDNGDDYGANHGVNYVHDDGDLSCSSSDLFELDHLSLIGNEYELPVYETTRIDPKFL